MSAGQMDVFGGCTPHKEPAPPPPKRKSDVPTCWTDCELCGQTPLSYRNKQFRICKAPGREHVRCFENDAICQQASLKKSAHTPSPVAPGWEDF